MKLNNEQRQFIMILLVCIVSILGIYGFVNRSNIVTTQQDTINEINLLLDTSNSNLNITTNSLGREVATTKNLQNLNSDLILTVQSNDSLVLLLQETIREHKTKNRKLQTVIVTKNETIAKYEDSSNNIVSDSIIIDNVLYFTYLRKIDMFGKWITGNIEIGKKYTHVNLVIINEYSTSVYRERKNMFSKYKYYTQITNLNPYTSTVAIKSFSETPIREKRWSVILFGGWAIGINTNPVIGIGIGYTLFKF